MEMDSPYMWLCAYILQKLLEPVVASVSAGCDLHGEQKRKTRKRLKSKAAADSGTKQCWMLKLTTSVMLRIFLVMVSLSWAGVGVNHNFWNVSLTSFYREHGIISQYLGSPCLNSWFTLSTTKGFFLQNDMWKAKVCSNSWIHTLMPSSSLTLRIILTHISVILLKAGCSRQMSLRILITRFLTLMPVSCSHTHTSKNLFSQNTGTKKTIPFPTNSCIWRNNTLSTTRWQQRTKHRTELLMNPVEHFYDNSHNNFNDFTSHLLRTKTKSSVCVMDLRYWHTWHDHHWHWKAVTEISLFPSIYLTVNLILKCIYTFLVNPNHPKV